MTIAVMAEVGFEGATLAEIAGRAGVSPGLVAHHFESKDGLLAAALRSLVRKVGVATLDGLRTATTPRDRLRAVIDAHLSDQDFDERAGAAWLAFWGHVPHDPRLRRLQRVYQRRMLSNLGDALVRLAVSRKQALALAGMIAALIDGVWLRAALSGWKEADGASARGLLAQFVESQVRLLEGAGLSQPSATDEEEDDGQARTSGASAVGDEAERAIKRARAAQPEWAALSETGRRAVILRAAVSINEAARRLARLEQEVTGSPVAWTAATVSAAGRWMERIASRPFNTPQALPTTHGLQRLWSEPEGVVVARVPARAPFLGACLQAAGALVGGNAVVVDAAPEAFASCVRLAGCLRAAGAPDVLQVVRGGMEDDCRGRGVSRSAFLPSSPLIILLQDADVDLACDAISSPRLPDEVCAPVVLVQRRLARKVLKALAERPTPKMQASGDRATQLEARTVAFDKPDDLLGVLRTLGSVRRAAIYGGDLGSASDLAARLPVEACVVNPEGPLDDAIVELIAGPADGMRRRRLVAYAPPNLRDPPPGL